MLEPRQRARLIHKSAIRAHDKHKPAKVLRQRVRSMLELATYRVRNRARSNAVAPSGQQFTMKQVLSSAIVAGVLASIGTTMFAQPSSPVQGSQPGTTAPGAQPLPPTGSGSAPIGPPASTPQTTPATPGTPSVPGVPQAPNTSKKLDTPSSGGGGTK
jgi:hypothetical protein